MGSPLSSLLSNLYVHMMEQTIVKNFEKSGVILCWLRFADDVICVCKKSSVNIILRRINSWSSKLQFTVEHMTENELVYLDCLLFLENEKLLFKKYRKRGLETVITNYKFSVTSKKYKVGNILTQLHRQKNCFSNDQLFIESLEEMREIYRRNLYPKKVVEKQIKRFLITTKGPKDRNPT